jgi:hypothetical protein
MADRGEKFREKSGDILAGDENRPFESEVDGNPRGWFVIPC